MKTLLAITTLLLSIAAWGCPDLTGTYAAPYNTTTEKTTFIYSQEGCDALAIAGTYAEAATGVTVLPTKTYSLSGMAPKDCGFSIARTCGTYTVKKDSITKILMSEELVDGGPHGACDFVESELSRDTSGNLVELMVASACEDGYKGPLSPILYPKSK